MTDNSDEHPFVARGLIEEATGIIMERFDLDAATALAVLRRMSNNTSAQMCVVAAQVINHQVPPDAVRGIEEDVLGRGLPTYGFPGGQARTQSSNRTGGAAGSIS
jgi:ANTAR domain